MAKMATAATAPSISTARTARVNLRTIAGSSFLGMTRTSRAGWPRTPSAGAAGAAGAAAPVLSQTLRRCNAGERAGANVRPRCLAGRFEDLRKGWSPRARPGPGPGTLLNGQALVARKIVLQVAIRDIGQLTDI
jgi:hypothetical protein